MGSYLRAPELESTEEAGPRPEEQLVNKAESSSREKWGGDGDSRGDSRSPLLQGHWWYLSLVTVAVFTPTFSVPVFGFPNPIIPRQSPLTGLERNPISVKFKDFATQVLASCKNPRDYTVQERVPGLSFSMVATVCAHEVYTRVGSLNTHSTHSLWANTATKTSALAPKLGRVELGVLSPGTHALTPSRGPVPRSAKRKPGPPPRPSAFTMNCTVLRAPLFSHASRSSF